jgi:hypothetical protein
LRAQWRSHRPEACLSGRDTTAKAISPDWSGSVGASNIGRVPWKTPDLPDFGMLMAAVRYSRLRCSAIIRLPAPLTARQLLLPPTGTPGATGVIAIIIAPGASRFEPESRPGEHYRRDRVAAVPEADNNAE